MPASNGQYYNAFTDLVGEDGQSETGPSDNRIGGWDTWRDLFESTGIDFDSSAETVEAFQLFLVAFYPQEGLSRDDWEYVRLEFADMYGLSEFDDDFWSSWREAIGY
jgi:hypothetical protein